MDGSSVNDTANGSVPLSGIVVHEHSSEVHPALMTDLLAEMRSRETLVEQVEEMMKQANPTSVDVIVIGGGPGGYVAAIRAAQLGGKVVLIEKDKLGGVCLNRGCIPTKAMLSCADAYDLITRRSGDFGITVGEVSLDYAKVLDRRDKVVNQLVSGVGVLMKKHNIQVLNGHGRVTSANSVEVIMADGRKETVTGRNIIVATGSEPVRVPIPGCEDEHIWDSDHALAAKNPPGRLLIIGGGYIGVEWGYMFQKFHCQVTIVEMMPQLLPRTDTEVAQELRKALEKYGIRILTESKVARIEHKDGIKVAIVETKGGEQQIECDSILIAIGRRPTSDGVGLADIGVRLDRGKVLVDDHMRTNVTGVYAIGDVVGGALLAHKASEEGVIAAENCMGRDSRMHYNAIPGAIYTTPEVATVGLSEEEAKQQGLDYKVGKFHFRVNGKALGLGERDGFVKFIADAKYGEILGCHIIGPHATDLIHEVVLGINAEATIETIGRAVHAHPTLAEVVHEAALDVNGESIHKG